MKAVSTKHPVGPLRRKHIKLAKEYKTSFILSLSDLAYSYDHRKPLRRGFRVFIDKDMELSLVVPR